MWPKLRVWIRYYSPSILLLLELILLFFLIRTIIFQVAWAEIYQNGEPIAAGLQSTAQMRLQERSAFQNLCAYNFTVLGIISLAAYVLYLLSGLFHLPHTVHGFTGESVAHARAEAEALKAAGVISDYMMGVGGEASKQIQAVDDILAWGPDAVMLWPLEGDQLRNAAQSIVDEGIPLVIYDRLIENFKGMAAEIMGDNEKIGNMMGEYLLKYFDEQLKAGETITYLLFIGDSSTVSKQRTDGMAGSLPQAHIAGNRRRKHLGFEVLFYGIHNLQAQIGAAVQHATMPPGAGFAYVARPPHGGLPYFYLPRSSPQRFACPRIKTGDHTQNRFPPAFG